MNIIPATFFCFIILELHSIVDCGFNWNRRPLLLEPENENLWTDIGDSAELRCTGFYGDLHDCGVWCSIDWMRQTNGSHYEGIYNTDTSHNVYVQDVEMV